MAIPSEFYSERTNTLLKNNTFYAVEYLPGMDDSTPYYVVCYELVTIRTRDGRKGVNPRVKRDCMLDLFYVASFSTEQEAIIHAETLYLSL